MKKTGLLLMALIWLGVVLFLSMQPRIVIEPSKDLKDLRRAYQKSDLEIRGLDAVKEGINQAAKKAMPAVDRLLAFYGTRTSDLGVKFDFVVRKAGHWSVYLILGLLIFGTLVQIPWGDFRISPYAWTLSLGLLAAIADESHQTLLRGRSGTVQDIAVDAAGVIGALGLVFLVRNISWLSEMLTGGIKSIRNGGRAKTSHTLINKRDNKGDNEGKN
ncbi:MAG: VanZ family protein [Bacillota bacterium]